MSNKNQYEVKSGFHQAVIKEIYLNKDFLEKFSDHYLTKLKEYSDKHTLVNYFDFTEYYDRFNIIILDKNNWLVLGPFIAFTYNNITKELLDLNQLVKDKYKFTDNVYLNFNSNENKSICKALLELLTPDRINTDVCFTKDYNDELLTYTSSNPEIYDLYCDFNTEKAKIFNENILRDYKEYNKYKRSEYNKLDITNKQANPLLNMGSPNNYFNVYNVHLLFEDKKEILQEISKNKITKTMLIPLTYFNITPDENIECALIFINPINNKIILPNIDKVNQMIKNNLLLPGNNVDIESLYRERKASTEKIKKGISSTFNINSETITYKDCIGFLNNQIIETIKKERETYSEFKFINPFYLSHLISPVIYGVTGSHHLNLEYENEKERFCDLPNIYSVTFNLNTLQKFFNLNDYIENINLPAYQLYHHIYTNINSIFLLNNNDNLKYIDNIHISYTPFEKKLYFKNEYNNKYKQGILCNKYSENLNIVINNVHSPDKDNVYQLTDKAEICKLNNKTYIINDTKTKLSWYFGLYSYKDTPSFPLIRYKLYKDIIKNNNILPEEVIL